jgi:CoA-transferase family III
LKRVQPWFVGCLDRVGSGDIGIEFPTELDLRNRNRRSVSIDLKRTEGRATFMGLVAQADILLERFRPRVAERLSIGPDDCLKRPKAAMQLTFAGAAITAATAYGGAIYSLLQLLESYGNRHFAAISPLSLRNQGF